MESGLWVAGVQQPKGRTPCAFPSTEQQPYLPLARQAIEKLRQGSVGQVYATRTISTEQWARAATADDTLPVRSLSTLPTPLAPTKMQSAFQPSASLSNSAFGSSSFTTTEVRNPACLSFSKAASIATLTLACSSATHSAIRVNTGSEVAVGILQQALTMRASLFSGQRREATTLTASSEPFEPSTPIIVRSGFAGP